MYDVICIFNQLVEYRLLCMALLHSQTRRYMIKLDNVLGDTDQHFIVFFFQPSLCTLSLLSISAYHKCNTFFHWLETHHVYVSILR